MTQNEYTFSRPENMQDLSELVLQLEAFCNSARGLIAEAIRNGEIVPDAALIPTKTNRKWVDTVSELQIRRALSGVLRGQGKPASIETIAPRKLVTVAEAERLVGKPEFSEAFARLVREPEPTGNYTLKLGLKK